MRIHAAIALAAGLCAAPAPETVRFAVAEGTVLEKTFEIGSKFVLEDMTVRMNGAVQPKTDLAALDIYARQDRRLVVLDQYLELGPQRPEKLRRRYESLTGKKVDRMPLMQPGGKEEKNTLVSDLQGSTVMFAWDGASKGFKASLLDGESKLDMSGIEEDMDLRFFLPQEAVEPGSKWTVDASVFDEIFSLGGDLGLEADEGGWFEEQLADLLEGDIKVAYVSLDDSGLATLDIKASLDFDGKITDERSGEPMKVTGHVNMQGTLFWNVKGGHFASLDLEAEMDLSMKMNPQGLGADLAVDMDMAFDVKIAGQAKAR